MQDQGAFYSQVGEKIRERRGKNLSQEALAMAVGLTRSSISNIEKGRQKLLLHTLIDIANALNVEAAALLPSRAAEVRIEDVGQLARLPENERAFIQSAIGISEAEKVQHGSETKKDKGARRDAPVRGKNHRGAGASVGHRPTKGGADRRRLP
jgi:transcriptional regulator with XRE-family HTH domain